MNKAMYAALIRHAANKYGNDLWDWGDDEVIHYYEVSLTGAVIRAKMAFDSLVRAFGKLKLFNGGGN